MHREMLRAKIHRAVVTRTDLNYEGSIAIASDLLEAAGIVEYEKVLVANLNNGHRCETYAIAAEAGAGEICMNGAAARWAGTGDRIIVMAFCYVDEKDLEGFKPTIVVLDERNAIVEKQ